MKCWSFLAESYFFCFCFQNLDKISGVHCWKCIFSDKRKSNKSLFLRFGDSTGLGRSLCWKKWELLIEPLCQGNWIGWASGSRRAWPTEDLCRRLWWPWNWDRVVIFFSRANSGKRDKQPASSKMLSCIRVVSFVCYFCYYHQSFGSGEAQAQGFFVLKGDYRGHCAQW